MAYFDIFEEYSILDPPLHDRTGRQRESLVQILSAAALQRQRGLLAAYAVNLVYQFRRQADFKPVLLTVGIRVERIPAVSGFGVCVGNQLSGAARLVPERAQSESGGRKISAVDFTGLFLKSFR